MSSNKSFLFANGVASAPSDTPPVATLLQTHSGAYTTTRTQKNGSELLFWERHLRRLSNSVKILVNSKPEFLFKPENFIVPFHELSVKSSVWDSAIHALVNNSMKRAVPFVFKDLNPGEEMAITALLSGRLDSLGEIKDQDEERIYEAFDVYLHFGAYVPPVFGIHGNAARLAVVGRGRDAANAKYSDWVRLRKHLEKLRPPSITELLLSNDGDHILEGSVTNFFVVCLKDDSEESDKPKPKGLHANRSVEIQTAPVTDGVLPGVMRQVIVDICSRNGIPLREVAPSWVQRDMWLEAFTTNSLRLIQQVETILFPTAWEVLESKTWMEVTWEEKQFEESPGRITSIIKGEIMERAGLEAYPVALFND